MIKTVICCDRCGKLIKESNYEPKYKYSLIDSCNNKVDLCDKCQEEVDDFIDSAISLPITNSETDIDFPTATVSIPEGKKGYWKLVKTNNNRCGKGRYNFDMICSSCGKVLSGFYNFTEEECRTYIEDVLSGECENKPKDDYYPPYCQYCGSKNEVKIDD